MHFADELVDATSFNVPAELKPNPKEMELAKALIGSMVTEWNPQKYQDDYKSALLEVIEEKIKRGEKAGAKRAPAPGVRGNIVNVMEMLERSLQGAVDKPRGKTKAKHHRKAA